MKREPAEPQGFIKLTGVGIPALQDGEEVNLIVNKGRIALTTPDMGILPTLGATI